MGIYFLDSSAIVKLYVEEVGSTWIADIADPHNGHALHVLNVSLVEVVSAIVRRGLIGGVPVRDLPQTCRLIRKEFWALFTHLDVSSALLSRAADLAERHSLRAYDSLQLAAAVQVDTECRSLRDRSTLISADKALNEAAAVEGLVVDDPNLHV